MGRIVIKKHVRLFHGAKGVTGKQVQIVLDQAGITVNRYIVPFETFSPMLTSGVRIGTAAGTRGFGHEEMGKIAGWIKRFAAHIGGEAEIGKVRAESTELCEEKLLYPGL